MMRWTGLAPWVFDRARAGAGAGQRGGHGAAHEPVSRVDARPVTSWCTLQGYLAHKKTPSGVHYRGTSLIRKRLPLGPYGSRVLVLDSKEAMEPHKRLCLAWMRAQLKNVKTPF